MFPYSDTTEKLSKINVDTLNKTELSETLYAIQKMQDVLKELWENAKTRLEKEKITLPGWQITPVAGKREIKNLALLIEEMAVKPGWTLDELIDKGIVKGSASEFVKAITALKTATDWPKNLEVYLNGLLTKGTPTSRLQKAKD